MPLEAGHIAAGFSKAAPRCNQKDCAAVKTTNHAAGRAALDAPPARSTEVLEGRGMPLPDGTGNLVRRLEPTKQIFIEGKSTGHSPGSHLVTAWIPGQKLLSCIWLLWHK